MTESIRKLSSIIDNEAKKYAIYTVQHRALASVIDGFKPVQRFVIRSALDIAKNDFVKVAAIGSNVSKYGYNHGEVSAQDACKLMAAQWNNNENFLTGRGNFGSRLVNESAASRYVYAKMSKDFFEIYSDFDILPKNDDLENDTPKYYIPIIPTILLNGVEGIATGFACKILPYSYTSLKKACDEYLNNKPITQLLPSFKNFSGEITRLGASISIKGVYVLKGYSLTITELPFGVDRETYISLLDKLEENGEIISYKDKCSNGFNFIIKLKTNIVWNDENIISKFKLEKKVTENLTMLDENGNIKIFDTPEDVVKYFVDFKLRFLPNRINNKLTQLSNKLNIIKNKMDWIVKNINNEINYRGLTKKSLIELISKLYGGEFIENILSVSIYQLTTDELEKLSLECSKIKDDLSYWESTTPKKEFFKII